jgi:hypothetical protein
VVLTALQQHVANDPSLTLEITQYSKGTWIFGDRARYGIKIDGPVEKLDLVKAWLQSRLDP